MIKSIMEYILIFVVGSFMVRLLVMHYYWLKRELEHPENSER
jgi:hypothetical protein